MLGDAQALGEQAVIAVGLAEELSVQLLLDHKLQRQRAYPVGRDAESTAVSAHFNQVVAHTNLPVFLEYKLHRTFFVARFSSHTEGR